MFKKRGDIERPVYGGGKREKYWRVRDVIFCEKCGIEMGVLDRLIDGGEVDVVVMVSEVTGCHDRYVVIDWRAVRLIEYVGMSVREEWYRSERDRNRGKSKYPMDVRIEKLRKYGRRIENGKKINTNGGHYFSIEEVAKFTGMRSGRINNLINIGILTGFLRKRRRHEWKFKERMYVVGDEYLEVFLEYIGAVCTGMTYEQAKVRMNALEGFGGKGREKQNTSSNASVSV